MEVVLLPALNLSRAFSCMRFRGMEVVCYVQTNRAYCLGRLEWWHTGFHDPHTRFMHLNLGPVEAGRTNHLQRPHPEMMKAPHPTYTHTHTHLCECASQPCTCTLRAQTPNRLIAGLHVDFPEGSYFACLRQRYSLFCFS